jgi:hypothetical protein
MRASLFFIINAGIVFFLILRIFAMGMTRGKPSIKVKMSGFDPFVGRKTSSSEKILNCFFTHEGHQYDAYAILDVPAGAPLEICQNSYAQNPKTELKERAWQALKSQRFS